MTEHCPVCDGPVGEWTNGVFADWRHCARYPDCLWVERIERERTDTRQLRLLVSA